MSWITRLLSDTALAPYVTPGAGTGLPARVAALLAQQHETWPLLRAGTVALAAAQYRSLQVNGSEVIAQYNPQRRVSTAAPVDATSIRARRCFLCAEHLPPEERGLAWGEDCVLLCNPFPVLPNHLVIAARSHIPQAIAGRYGTLLDLAAALGETYWVLYNGPACGASAPDHLHVQAGTRALLPILHEVEHWPQQQVVQQAHQEVFALTGYRLQVLIARGSTRSTLLAWLQHAVAALAAVTRASEHEPLLNLLVTCDSHWLDRLCLPARQTSARLLLCRRRGQADRESGSARSGGSAGRAGRRPFYPDTGAGYCPHLCGGHPGCATFCAVDGAMS